MTITESPPTTPAPAPAPEKPTGRTDATPSVRSVLVGAGSVVAVIAGAGAFAAGGWIALGAIGAAAAAGTAGLVRAKAGDKKRRPGLGRRFQLTVGRTSARPRLGGPGKGGSLSRPRPVGRGGRAGGRAGSPITRARGAMRAASRNARGNLTALAPGKKGQAARAARAARKAGPSRPHGVPARPMSRIAARPASPRQSLTPRTGTRTPARPGTRPALTAGAKLARRVPTAAGTRRAAAKAGLSPRFGVSRVPKRPVSPPSLRSVATRRKGLTSSGKFVPRRPGTPGRLASRPGVTSASVPKRRRHAVPGTRTTSARRLGTQARTRKVLPSRVPNRSARRLTPKPPATTARLLRDSVGVPNWKGKRPTPAVRRRARRVIAKRTRLTARKSAAWGWSSTKTGVKAATQFRVWPNMPGPIPDIPIPTDAPKLKTQPGKRHLTVVKAPKPQTAPPTPITQGATTMTVAIQTGIEAARSIAAFTPSTPEEMSAYLTGLGEMYTELMQAHASNAAAFQDGLPIDSTVVEAMQAIGSACGSIVDHVNAAEQTYRAAHETELARREAPRTNEKFWDVSNQ